MGTPTRLGTRCASNRKKKAMCARQLREARRCVTDAYECHDRSQLVTEQDGEKVWCQLGVGGSTVTFNIADAGHPSSCGTIQSFETAIENDCVKAPVTWNPLARTTASARRRIRG
mmetsp:Transcript_94048/g.270969  ORF Transcript_94048/g.270969 Transcript_94048/m.270969 type:complete len:115 (+) Transcript_94048:186-530(+)